MKRQFLTIFIMLGLGILARSYWFRPNIGVLSSSHALSGLSVLVNHHVSDFLKPNRRYVGSLSGSVMRDVPLVVQGELGIGRSAKQQLIHRSGFINMIPIKCDILIEGQQLYVKLDPNSAKIIDQDIISGEKKSDKNQGRYILSYELLTWLYQTITSTPGSYIHLKGYYPGSWIQLILDPYQGLRSMIPYITTQHETCPKAGCTLVFDHELLAHDYQTNPQQTLSGLTHHGLYASAIKFILSLKEQSIVWKPTKVGLEFTLKDTLNNELQATISEKGFQSTVVAQGIYKTIYEIERHDIGNQSIIDTTISDDQGSSTQSRRTSYSIFPDGWDMIIDSSYQDQVFVLEGKRYDQGNFLPIDKGSTISIYGILGK
ncbi:MAG TPA: hypothetical protein PLW93_00860 [Candidatus Absconditabacterales bacterium]|nr:hypothetical protein [Candidatus Absconditabacterales bacterium]HNG96801.1 hypothetical protein [Candidatus Absconditabacterales bacterium]